MVDISDKLGRAACTELQNEYSKDNVMFHLCDVTKIEQLVSCAVRRSVGWGACCQFFFSRKVHLHGPKRSLVGLILSATTLVLGTRSSGD